MAVVLLLLLALVLFGVSFAADLLWLLFVVAAVCIVAGWAWAYGSRR